MNLYSQFVNSYNTVEKFRTKIIKNPSKTVKSNRIIFRKKIRLVRQAHERMCSPFMSKPTLGIIRAPIETAIRTPSPIPSQSPNVGESACKSDMEQLSMEIK